MLISLKEVIGYKMHVRDGEAGNVTDFLFDQQDWTVRYVVDKTAKLFGKEVLLSTYAINKSDWRDQSVTLDLSQEQIKKSPKIRLKDILQPNQSRFEQEGLLSEHYGWMGYWGGLGMQGSGAGTAGAGTGTATAGGIVPLMGAKETNQEKKRRSITQDKDFKQAALQSADKTFGFEISTSNGDLGQVEDFIVDENDWTIRFMVIDTKNNMNHKKVLVAPEAIDWVSWTQKQVSVDMEKEKLEGCPNFQLTFPLSREYQEMLYDQYECRQYWNGNSDTES